MASRRFDNLQTLGLNQVIVAGSFTPLAVPTNPDSKSRGWSVTVDGTGQYTVTFDDSYPQLVAKFVDLQVEVDTANVKAIVRDWDATAKTLQINLVVPSTGAATGAHLAADANIVISFMCVFRNGSV